MTVRNLIPLLTLLLLLWSSAANSLLASNGLRINGTLVVAPLCTVVSAGGEQQIVTDFGEHLGVNRIDGVEYLQEVNDRITCDAGSTEGFELKLSVVGTATTYDRAALVTSIPDLGIQLRQSGLPFELNRAITTEDNSSNVSAGTIFGEWVWRAGTVPRIKLRSFEASGTGADLPVRRHECEPG